MLHESVLQEVWKTRIFMLGFGFTWRTPEGRLMSEPIVHLTIGGCEMAIAGDPDDIYFATLGGQWAKNRAFEAYALANLPSDAICLDIGANIGLTALLLSRRCSAGYVYA